MDNRHFNRRSYICDGCLSYARKQMESFNNNSNHNGKKNESVDNFSKTISAIVNLIKENKITSAEKNIL